MAAEDCISARKGATKHCCWRACNSGSRYLEDSNGIFFIRFPMPQKLKDSMTDWDQIKQDTKKCKMILKRIRISALYILLVAMVQQRKTLIHY